MALLLHWLALGICIGLELWPAGEELPANGQVVLTGVETARSLVLTLASRNPRLVSGKDIVPLKIDLTFEGEGDAAQVVLTPARLLRVGATYRFEADGAGGVVRRYKI